MRFRSTVLCLVLSSLVWLVAVVPLCAAVPGDTMPCCRTGAGCDLAMRASGCCRLGAVTDQQMSHAPVRPPRLSQEPVLLPSALPSFLLSAPPTTTLITLAGPPGFLEHRVAGPPLFLLNATLLR